MTPGPSPRLPGGQPISESGSSPSGKADGTTGVRIGLNAPVGDFDPFPEGWRLGPPSSLVVSPAASDFVRSGERGEMVSRVGVFCGVEVVFFCGRGHRGARLMNVVWGRIR